MAKHNILGEEGENLATDYLVKNGYRILERNWTHSSKKYEIDIIAKNEEYIIFVEVKTRYSDTWGNPEDSVSDAQMKRIIEAADQYLNEKDIELDARFDIVAVIKSKFNLNIEHIEDAFYPSF